MWERSTTTVGASYDGRNAFGNMKRMTILKGLLEKAPELVPYFKACYSTGGLMFFFHDPICPPLYSDEGVGQGDTLALFYYCIGQAVVTEMAQDQLAQDGIYVDMPAYADNIFIPPTLSPPDC